MNLPAMNLVSRFYHVAAANPNAVAVIDQACGNQTITYAQLNAQSNRIAGKLLAQGIAPETCIGVRAGRTPAMLAAILGILKAGACYVPMAPNLPTARQQHIIQSTSMAWLLSENEDNSPGVMNIAAAIEAGNTISQTPAPDPGMSNAPLVASISPGSLAYIMFTSGTTGPPKGAMIEHGNVLNLVDGIHSALAAGSLPVPREKVLLLGSIGFDATSFEIWSTLLGGGTLVTISDEDRINPEKLKTHIENNGITTLLMTTGFCQQVLNDTPTIFSSLNTLLIGGDQLCQPTVATLREYAPQTRIFNVYGPTENTVFTSVTEISPDAPLNTIPIGFALPGVEVTIENPQGQILPAGETGELVLRGKQVFRGYINETKNHQAQDNKINENDTRSPHSNNRKYRSGDLGYVNPNGALVFVSRKDNQVKINGYRIEPGEVEHALLKLDNVAQAVVKPQLDEHQNKMLVAWVVAKSQRHFPQTENANSNNTITSQNIADSLQQLLPDYMLPSEIIILERFALDNNGKIDRNALAIPESISPEQINAGQISPPTNRKAQSFGASSPPQTLADIETLVQNVFSKALKQTVSLSDDFFDLGGNSITALKIFGKLKGLTIKLSDIMHYRTAGKLAAHAYANLSRPEETDNQQPGSSPTPTPAHTKDLAIYSAEVIRQIRADYQQNNQRIRQWQPEQRIGFSPIQNLQASFTVPMSLGVCDIKPATFTGDTANFEQKIKQLQQAIAHTINKHELLRSTPLPQASSQGEFVQRYFQCYQPQPVNSKHMLQASVVDLSPYNLSDEDFFETGKRIVSDLQCNAAGAAPDLMCHFVIIRRTEAQYYIVSIVHHSLFDRCSDELLQRDFRRFALERTTSETAPETMPENNNAPRRASFSHYVNTLNSGPQHVSQTEIIQDAKLNHYHQYKTQALESKLLQPSQTAQNFDIAVPLPASVVSELPVGAAAAIYTNAICNTCHWQGIPMLFIYEARRYLNQDYYDVLGELIDYVPIALHHNISPVEAQSRILNQLRFANQNNVNFLKLMLETPTHQSDQIHPLIYPGNNLQHIDFTMFNFLGNAEPGISYRDHYSETIHTAPHPLPIQSFLNCIVTCYHDGLLYKIRGSYQTSVPQLREAFARAAEEWAGTG